MKLKALYLRVFMSMVTLLVCFSCEDPTERIPIDSEDFGSLKNILEAGVWAWEDQYCDKSSHTIRFNMDEKTMTLTLDNEVPVNGEKQSIYVYDIKWAWKRGFRGKIRGEKRLDKQGKPIEWDLFVVDENSFYWRRSDWSKTSGSKPIINCTSRKAKR